MNNYKEDDVQRLSSLKSSVAYLIFGREVGESGTPHLQGFVSFPSRKRLSQCVSLLGQCHFSIARSITKSIEYCKKDGNFTEIGDSTSLQKQGKRNNLQAFKEDVQGGMFDLRDIREKHSMVYARYPRFVQEYLRDHRPIMSVPLFPLREWQTQVYQKLQLPPDDRSILFLVDLVGNKGKSWFFRYYEQTHPRNTQIILPGKKADMCMFLRETCRVFLFDCPRSKQGEFIQYDMLEQVKNGLVFSGKYEATDKRFPTPHVVVAMNEHPNMEALSEDRYDIMVL